MWNKYTTVCVKNLFEFPKVRNDWFYKVKRTSTIIVNNLRYYNIALEFRPAEQSGLGIFVLKTALHSQLYEEQAKYTQARHQEQPPIIIVSVWGYSYII